MLLGTGCYAQGTSSQIGLLGMREDLLEVEILGRDVEGEDCPPFSGGYGDYGAAVTSAIRSVQGANVLLNGEFASREAVGWPGPRICVRVRGDAGVVR